jgi:hypothetical protein
MLKTRLSLPKPEGAHLFYIRYHCVNAVPVLTDSRIGASEIPVLLSKDEVDKLYSGSLVDYLYLEASIYHRFMQPKIHLI